MIRTQEMTAVIQPHNERPAKVWSAGGSNYNDISRGIADSIEHCVLRLNPRPGERILDLATGTGWTSRLVARRGAIVTGVDIATGLLEAAERQAAAEHLSIQYVHGDAEALPFDDGELRCGRVDVRRDVRQPSGSRGERAGARLSVPAAASRSPPGPRMATCSRCSR